MKLTETQLQQLAAQLRCPDGEVGLKVAEMMTATNANIINKTIASLKLNTTDSILEIGPGNAGHLKTVPAIAEGAKYLGIDISPTMIAEALKLNAGLANVSFLLTDGNSIPFGDRQFNKIFTANTIYFWQQPQEYANEIARVLQPGGCIAIAFIPKITMQHIPFAKFGFTLYDAETVGNLLSSAGFTITNTILDTEFVTSNSGEQIEREFVIITATRL
ncbi:class I SAM-dependent methyltransferase [Flavobacterium zepuense]|uniref:Class I SAM-dependent methyltransferase n=1 Tax=Flavobacterium zepuense TaxID=2593302 RepID=A0A552VAS2_9FLAO|nr:class I SAM-dependent methyltransferase [Flavobacterium zepuense]TRW27460.1 class I SAM-dependent methyltransferase [Flavobacterium zepuense]